MPVAYNPYDQTQQAFLAALALGESNGKDPYHQGTGGTDLSGSGTDAYGFPIWGGFGNSHAAGAYQFQPGTWDKYAKDYNLQFQNPGDQNAGAWYLAQDTYKQKTGGDLASDLKAGKYTSIQSALAAVWPSVTGNGASPGLANALSNGQGAQISGGNPISADTSGGEKTGGVFGPLVDWLAQEFSRIGILFIGSIILLIALWYLLSETGAVPSPTQTAKAVGKAAALAV